MICAAKNKNLSIFIHFLRECSRLKEEPQDKFSDPSRLRAANHSKPVFGWITVEVSKVSVRIIEMRMVEQVEEFTAELQLQPFMKDEITLKGEIGIVQPRSMQRKARRISKRPARSNLKCCRAKPVIQRPAARKHGAAGDVRALRSSASGQVPVRLSNRERETDLQLRNARHFPPGNKVFHNGSVGAVFAAAAERQLINVVGHKTLRNIVRGNSPFTARIINVLDANKLHAGYRVEVVK